MQTSEDICKLPYDITLSLWSINFIQGRRSCGQMKDYMHVPILPMNYFDYTSNNHHFKDIGTFLCMSSHMTRNAHDNP